MDTKNNSQVMVCLVGEQNAPNLIPILHYKPAEVVLVYSDFTRTAAGNLQAVLTSGVHLCPTDAYDIEQARQAILDLIGKRGWRANQLLFNLTGGTKLMSIAGYEAAQSLGACGLIYLRTGRNRSDCYEYSLNGQAFMLTPGSPFEIEDVLTLDIYLRAQGLTGWKKSRPKNAFEQLVSDTLKGQVSELKIGMGDPSKTADIDLLVRCKNQVGVIEIKAWAAIDSMEGVKQLSTYASPRSFGTYARRMLVGSRRPQPNVENFAQALGIPVIVLPSFEATQGHDLSKEDKSRLIGEVKKTLLGTST